MFLLIDISNMFFYLYIISKKKKKIKIISFMDCGLFVFSIMLFNMYIFLFVI